MVQLVNTIDPPKVERLEAEAVNKAERRPLYEARVKIHPKRASGYFRQLKWIVMLVTLGIYYLAPWIRWDRGPHAPDQAILVDLAHRRFYFFSIEIWPQEFYYVAGLLIMAGVGLFLITSIAGRAWCGYTCPQTVWTDLFLVVERWVEGDRNARIKLDAAPWSFDKLGKRTVKMALWLLIAVATGGAWVFYFADAPTLAKELATFTAPSVAYFSIAILTATTFVFAGFMREQVCTYMCPWPRIQGAMLDEHSLVVTYNAWRGEPRSGHRKKAELEGRKVGDCVDCNACVAVCPMGIDIRDGNQLECINCALCIDACDSVMEKIGLPKGLISYSTASIYASCSSGKPASFSLPTLLRPRTIIYASLWSAIGLVMLYALSSRERLDVNVVADRNPLYVTLSDGAIRNGYTVKILNMQQRPRQFALSVAGLRQAAITMVGVESEPAQSIKVDVEADKLQSFKVYVATSNAEVREAEATDFRFVVQELNASGEAEAGSADAIFHGPGK
jgi:cytochrome c oxidase accessory protein FixG